MISMDEADSVSISVYDVMTSWSTPSCIFLILNLIIGTIAITSRFAATQRKSQLDRSASSILKDEPTKTNTEPALNHDSIGLDKATSFSLLDRVKSFNLSLCKIENNKDSNDLTRDPLTRAPSLLERLMSGNFHRIESVKLEEEEEKKCEADPNDLTRDPLIRAPSLLERLMSGNFRRIGSVKLEEEEEKKCEVESEPNREIEIRGRGEEEGVDAKADDFIKRFKQQLRLERLDSILRYRDILHRN